MVTANITRDCGHIVGDRQLIQTADMRSHPLVPRKRRVNLWTAAIAAGGPHGVSSSAVPVGRKRPWHGKAKTSRLQLGLLLPMAFLLAGCSQGVREKQVAKAAEAPVPIQMAAAEVRKIERTIWVTGSLLPDETVNVSAEVSGRVMAIHADFGQRVRKGDVLAEIDKQELVLQLEGAKASRAQALARAGLRPGQEEVTPESTPAIRQALAQLEDVRFRYESARQLVKTGDVARAHFVEIENAYAARKAALDAAQDELRLLLANIQALRAEVRLSEKRLNDAVVRAPFDGAVTARMISPGQYINANTPILTLVKASPLRLRAEIPELMAGDVQVGTTLSFSTGAASNVKFHAVVRALNPSLDARSRSLVAEARLMEDDASLRPGMFVQVRLVTQRDTAVVTAPKAAFYVIAGLTKIFVVRDSKAVEIQLTPGQEAEGWVEVPGGLVRAGEPVAVSDLSALVDGTPVVRKR